MEFLTDSEMYAGRTKLFIVSRKTFHVDRAFMIIEENNDRAGFLMVSGLFLTDDAFEKLKIFALDALC